MTIKAYQITKTGLESVSITLNDDKDLVTKLASFIHDFSSLKLKHSKEGRKFGNGQRGGKWYFQASNGRYFTPEIGKSLGLAIRFKDDETVKSLTKVIKDVDFIVNKYLKG